MVLKCRLPLSKGDRCAKAELHTDFFDANFSSQCTYNSEHYCGSDLTCRPRPRPSKENEHCYKTETFAKVAGEGVSTECGFDPSGHYCDAVSRSCQKCTPGKPKQQVWSPITPSMVRLRAVGLKTV